MSRRITLLIEDSLDKKLRYKQAKMIQKTSKSVSYSQVVISLLRESLN